MLFRKAISLYSENHTKPINSLGGQNEKLLIMKGGGTCLPMDLHMRGYNRANSDTSRMFASLKVYLTQLHITLLKILRTKLIQQVHNKLYKMSAVLYVTYFDFHPTTTVRLFKWADK
jgi:hypothetical protein